MRIRRGQYSKTFVKRFLHSIKINQKTGCWNWLRSLGAGGYGQINDHDRQKVLRSHRVSWTLFCGDIPSDMCVLHKCDNRKCCNPNHLFLGDRTDNHNDKINKNRQPVGMMLPQAKLTDDNIRHIRASNKTGVELAKQYNVRPSTISKIRCYKRWKHIK